MLDVVAVRPTVLVLKKGMKEFIAGRNDTTAGGGGTVVVVSFPAADVLSICSRKALDISRSFFNNANNSSLFDAALFNFSRNV